ncbi:MAG: ATP-binding protein [Candidatus Kapaibacterium sp.]
MARKNDVRKPVNIREQHYKNIQRKHILRLLLTYLVPLIVLIVYFQVQYSSLLDESRNQHLKTVAESQAKTLDLFLRERIINLINLIDDPRLNIPPDNTAMTTYLEKLRRDSNTFIDIGFFDQSGVQENYAGPYPELRRKDYSGEQWLRNLIEGEKRFIITDIYMGFRKKPHFTIAVKRALNAQTVVLRATLDPQKIYDYMTSVEGSGDVNVSIINSRGRYQVVTPTMADLLDTAVLVPPSEPHNGIRIDGDESKQTFAYSWLKAAEWAVIVKPASAAHADNFFGVQNNLIIFSLIIIIFVFTIILYRAKKFVQIEKEKDIARLQLEHASKLASVGELASGIAHEINNPLAIIASETGLIQDMISDEFGRLEDINEINPMLENINDATFRCREITRKLLSFVRQTDIQLRPHNLNEVISDVVDGFFERELAVSNIKLNKHLDEDLPEVVTEANQLKQVLLNIMNNAADAITPPGEITIETKYTGDSVRIAISDTGKGISKEEMDKIFLPFYSTKEVGKGTGLGLSVSYGIIQNLGGRIEVESVVGEGSTFTIILPAGNEPES